MRYVLAVSLCLVAASNVWVTDGQNDQTEIQAAVDAAQEQGHGVVYLSDGEYQLTATLPWYRRWEAWAVIALCLSLCLSLAVNVFVAVKMSRQLLSACLAPLLCLVAASAQAEMFHIVGERQAYLSPTGDFPGWQYGIYTDERTEPDLEMDFDWEANTVTWGDFWLDEPEGITFYGAKSYTTGPGEMDRIHVRIQFDPFSSESFTSTVSTLTPAGAGYFITGPAHPIGSPLTLTGNYRIIGPTSTVEGPVSVTFNNTSSVHYTSVFTGSYPRRVDLSREAAATWSGGGTLVDTVVDGYPVVVGLSSISYRMNFPSAVRVPEPSTLVLLLIGLVCLAVHRRVRY